MRKLKKLLSKYAEKYLSMNPVEKEEHLLKMAEKNQSMDQEEKINFFCIIRKI